LEKEVHIKFWSHPAPDLEHIRLGRGLCSLSVSYRSRKTCSFEIRKEIRKFYQICSVDVAFSEILLWATYNSKLNVGEL